MLTGDGNNASAYTDMIYKALQLLTEQLNSNIALSFGLNEDIVFLSPVKDNNKAYPGNRVSVSLVGVERDTSAGINFQRKAVSDSIVKQSAPAWQMNVNVLIAVIFQDKQYEESLQVLSAILRFLQKSNLIASQNNDTSLAVDVVNLSVHEMSNLWGICGDNYYPSVMCRLRVITIDEQEIITFSGLTKGSDIVTGIKNSNN